MNRPWMPLYVADYRADTAHLNAAQHGAYLLLIMHYWQTGGLPVDDAPLARIACMTTAEWRKARPVVASFFTSEWRHKRIDAELARAAEISSKRRASAEQRYSKRNANAEQLDTHARASSQSQSHISKPNGLAAEVAAPEPVGEDPKTKLFRVGKTALVSWGIAEKRTGSLIGQWLKAKSDPIGLLAAIQYARDQNVADPVAYVSSLVHAKDTRNGPTNTPRNGGDLARELAAEVREREANAGLFRPPDAVRSD